MISLRKMCQLILTISVRGILRDFIVAMIYPACTSMRHNDYPQNGLLIDRQYGVYSVILERKNVEPWST